MNGKAPDYSTIERLLSSKPSEGAGGSDTR